MKKIIKIKINNHPTDVEVDTGCPIIMIGKNLYCDKFTTNRLKPFDKSLHAASGHEIRILGKFLANIKANGRSGNATIIVQNEDRKYPLLGAEGLNLLFPGLQKTFEVNLVNIKNLESKYIRDIKLKYKNLWQNDDPIRDFKVSINLKKGAVPIFSRARPVPFAIRVLKKNYAGNLTTPEIPNSSIFVRF